jgi:hypothetical protein
MRQEGLSWCAAFFSINPIANLCDPAAWDRLLEELLDRFPLGTVPSPLATYLTVRLVERCPDMARLSRATKLLRSVFGVDGIGAREIGEPEALMRAARYYYHWRRLGVAVSAREVAAHVGVSPTLAARWIAHWKRGEAYDQVHYRGKI